MTPAVEAHAAAETDLSAGPPVLTDTARAHKLNRAFAELAIDDRLSSWYRVAADQPRAGESLLRAWFDEECGTDAWPAIYRAVYELAKLYPERYEIRDVSGGPIEIDRRPGR